ncbi:Uncharacterised protein [Vibrio cholerae]|nr:Uncharacterised protein [Vibrio cholerae]
MERITSSGQISRHFLMRSKVRSACPGRFIIFSTRGLACWNGISK